MVNYLSFYMLAVRPILRTGVKRMSSVTKSLHGLVFDMDGTLTVPCLDFKNLRKMLGITDHVDILSHVATLSGEEWEKSMMIIEKFEEEGREKLKIQPGFKELFEFLLDKTNLNIALVTRNSEEGVEHFLQKCKEMGICTHKEKLFSMVLTRDFKPVKPHPAAIIHIAEKWNTEPKALMMIGDDKNDINCGNAAGATTILLNNEKNEGTRNLANFNVFSLLDIIPIVKDRLRVQV